MRFVAVCFVDVGAVAGCGWFFGCLVGLDLRGICVVVMFCAWGVCGYYARFADEFGVVYCCYVVFCFCFVGLWFLVCFALGFAV